ncbi:phage Gp37/Gp68 family protein [Delftia tsuruhatensis]|uniref:phage Gp37/Gp68 family protein n=1 Tax=Delftia tsuruhatensis TaxID=180282 RepID=UPI002260BE18|nr:phage Gp37/Gp68 family protein [Delftia tsuruhatensis]MCX7505927.1 phage Gp37/Gp68 family protein [Delftia tsuruhatensis]
MSQDSKIEWTDHTFNPWEGCQRVGPGCDHCYAETRNARYSGGQAINWGPGAPRRRTSVSNWNLPRRWNAQAEAFQAQHGRRQRVFCASLADVFDNAVSREWRDELAALILDTPDLDWLLLTKRIGNAGAMLGEMFLDGPPANVWLGATVVNQAEADRDILKLLRIPASVRFLSMEPLLGPVSFEGFFANPSNIADGTNALEELDWVIAGGESGPGARPTHPNWHRELRDQCEAVGTPFLFKQWGEFAPALSGLHFHPLEGCPQFLSRAAGQDTHDFGDGYGAVRIGKKAAGRELDGKTWDEFPVLQHTALRKPHE